MASVDYLVEILMKTFDSFISFFPKNTVITFVPTTKRRLKQRGFNQAEILAQRLADYSGLELLPLLKRFDKSQQQAKLSRADRKLNLSNSIAANECFKKFVNSGHLILVDDIATTCSTLNECSKALRYFHPSEITAFVLARSYLV
ncbi:hypothetical protein GF354_05955 [Candidatus Peregrinibacteria bacterium]|nr:hypothetical protein [Candidatus Peregrinibacteria bacterium]